MAQRQDLFIPCEIDVSIGIVGFDHEAVVLEWGNNRKGLVGIIQRLVPIGYGQV